MAKTPSQITRKVSSSAPSSQRAATARLEINAALNATTGAEEAETVLVQGGTK